MIKVHNIVDRLVWEIVDSEVRDKIYVKIDKHVWNQLGNLIWIQVSKQLKKEHRDKQKRKRFNT